MKKYLCMGCKSEDVTRKDNISKEYEDDYMLECPKCKNWEEVGNNKPSVFQEI